MYKRSISLILLLLLLLPCARPALAASGNGILNGRCTLDWKGFCNQPSRLSDNHYKTGVDLKNGSRGGIYWTSDVPVGIVYWEWMVPPDECRYTFYDKDNQPLSTSIRLSLSSLRTMRVSACSRRAASAFSLIALRSIRRAVPAS